MEESKLTLSDIRINGKIKLLRPLILNMLIERGIDNDTYVLAHDELGLFAIQKTLDRAKRQIQDQITELWKEYIDWPEDKLTAGGLRFRYKLLEYLSEDKSV